MGVSQTPPVIDWGLSEYMPAQKQTKTEPDSKSWQFKKSSFLDKDIPIKEFKYADFEDGPDSKKKYFVINQDEEMNILCHSTNPKDPEDALREAL